jgi:hypothetical protein
MFQSDYINGVLFVETPRKVRAYKYNSKTAFKTIVIHEDYWEILDARWQGANIVIALRDIKGKKQSVRSYSDFAQFMVIKTS